MSNDERPETLAAQAAAWVPPWERQQRPPDRAYQAAAEAAARADAEGDEDEQGLGPEGDAGAEEPGPEGLAGAGESGPVGLAVAGESRPEGLAVAGESGAEGLAVAGESGVDGSGGGYDFAEAEELAAADDLVDEDDAAADEISGDERDGLAAAIDERPDDDEERSIAGLSDDDDDFDSAFEGANPAGYSGDSDPPDESEMSDEEVGGGGLGAELEPGEDDLAAETDGLGADDEDEDEPGGAEAEEVAVAGAGDEPVSVDLARGEDDSGPEPSAGELGPELPLPEAVEDAAEEVVEDDLDGIPADAPLPVDAGDVFDTAADDDVSDDGVDDLPVDEDVPAEGDGDDDPAARAGDADQPAADLPAADQPAADQLTTQPAAGDAPGQGRAKAVPEQGRRRRAEPLAVVDAGPRTSEDLPELTDEAELAAALEAILLVVDEPVGEMQLAQILEQPTERVGTMLENISARYTAAGHGFDLRRAAGGWRLYTRPEYAAYVERFVLDGQSVRLTQAALETLAVVAYKQPVTRSRISAIRGVNCDGVMRTLVTRGLIEECGTEGETGAYLYRTTALFLEKLGLNSVDQLPPLAPFLPDDVEEVLDAPG